MSQKRFWWITGSVLCVTVAITAARALPHSSSQPALRSLVLMSDTYPLYSGASWGAPHEASLNIPPAPLAGVQADAAPITNTMDPESIFMPFLTYYENKLALAGWAPDTTLAANGPGSGLEVYRKGSQIIALMYASVFHTVSSSSPEQCPCDVTLSIFSGQPYRSGKSGS